MLKTRDNVLRKIGVCVCARARVREREREIERERERERERKGIEGGDRNPTGKAT